MAEQVGVRELRDQLSGYLDRVRHGEEIEVTERGRPIAMLVPLPESRANFAELVAAGVITPAAREWRRTARLPVPAGEPLASAVLDEQRADLE
jgi:prevent-host-death family protein